MNDLSNIAKQIGGNIYKHIGYGWGGSLVFLM